MNDPIPEPDPLEKLAAKADEIKAPKLDEDFEAKMGEKLADIESRSRIAQRRVEKDQTERSGIVSTDQESYRSLGIGLTIAYALIGMPVLCFGIGYGVDYLTGGNWGKALGTLLGAVAGLWYAIMILNRTSQRK